MNCLMSAYRTAAGPARTRQSTASGRLWSLVDADSMAQPTAFFDHGVIKPPITYAVVKFGRSHNKNESQGVGHMLRRATLIAGAAIATAAIGSASQASAQGECPEGYYLDRATGDCVPRPEPAPTQPPGATALCMDGTWSFSEHPYSGGTCHGHGGVQKHLT
jgi:Protein of unknown function (DUF3761)